MTYRELYETAVKELAAEDIEDSEWDAMWLLEYAAGLGRAQYFLRRDEAVPEKHAKAYRVLIERRKTRIPYQYLTGEAHFMGMSFKVTKDVLIPRADTEVLAEKTLEILPDNAAVLDICTGSGCIGISLKAKRPDISVTLSDISPAALDVARENARLFSDIKFKESDLFSAFGESEIFNVIVSNPPYVTKAEYVSLAPEIKDHEPAAALLAGEDGLDIYKRLIPEAFRHLAGSEDDARAGILALETGCLQAGAVTRLMKDAGFTGAEVFKDLAGLDRVVIGRKGKNV